MRHDCWDILKFSRRPLALRGMFLGACAALALTACSGPPQEGGAVAPSAEVQASALKEPNGSGSEQRLRILTEDQYLNTIAYVFGPDIRPITTFPPSPRTDGLLAAGTSRGGITTQQLEIYQKAALTVSAMVVDPQHRNFLISCRPASETAADDACASEFLGEKGRLLNRRPLTKNELAVFVAQAGKAANTLNDFYSGLAVALEAMLVSPNVLFVTEISEPDPQHPDRRRLNSYSLATRLSLFLWNSAPDDGLLKAAEKGELHTAKGFAREVDRMLTSVRLEMGMRAFFDDMFAFDIFDTLSKDATVYPKFTGRAMADSREETIRTVINHLVVQKKDYRDLYTTRETFISPSLAVIYGLTTPPTWTRYEFPPGSQRAGILTHVSFLAGHSHPGRSSATLRGKALRELLLCQPVPRPPANVDFSALNNPPPGLLTQRDRVNFHLENPVCAGCHKITDPMGLALENFDGSGRYRETEKGVPIDVSGSLDGRPFTDVVGLGQAVHDHPALTTCLVKRAYAYATGGPTTSRDRAVLKYFDERFAEGGYRLIPLLRTIALSEAFSEIFNDQEQVSPEQKTASAPPSQIAAVGSE